MNVIRRLLMDITDGHIYRCKCGIAVRLCLRRGSPFVATTEIKSLTEDFYLEMRPSCIQMLQCLFYRNIKSVSTDIKARVYTHLEKHILPATRDAYGFPTMLKLFALLY